MTIACFLRGINVGGHHKVPMADLKRTLEKAGYEKVRTLLNSGNIILETKKKDLSLLESSLEKILSGSFGFPVPVIVREQKEIISLVKKDPFAGIEMHKDIRLYVSFLKSKPVKKIKIPYLSEDKAFRIIMVDDKNILSYLDLTQTKTTKGMDDLEKLFGKNITTRNWNTILKVSLL